MITASINILIYTALIFVLGMYKLQWPLFFVKNPSRFTIMIITLVGVMVSATLFGEGTRQKKLLMENNPTTAQPINTDAVPVPAPVTTKSE